MEKCPKCGQEDINIEMRGHNPNFQFSDSGISALKFEGDKDATILKAECGSCHTELQPTRSGYRIK